MTKKQMYGRLAFIAFTFLVVILVLIFEFTDFSGKSKQDVSTGEELISTPIVDDVDGTDDNNGNENGNSLPINNDNGLIEDTDDELTKEDSEIVMVFAGDIYMSDYVLNAYNRHGIDGIVSKELKNEIIDADIAMANQEFAFSRGGTKASDKQFTFRVDPEYGKAFNEMGLDIVTLANNHSLDYGEEALKDSFLTLDELDIKYVGAGNNIREARETKYFDIKNKTIAYLAASRVIPVTTWNAGENSPGLFTTYDPSSLIEEIKVAREKSDYVVVYVHWGIEKNTRPEAYQRNMAKQYIDAGADLVVGSHPHVLQGIEYYNGKPIVYSLGNFIFYNTINQTALLKVTLNDQNEVQLSLLPCFAESAMTKFINEDKKDEFYNYIESISYDITFKEGMASIE